MKAARLLSILLLLQTRSSVTADELANRLEVSRRTIYRDIEALSSTGVPVYTDRGRGGGIALLPGYRTDVTGLTSDEARSLFVVAAQDSYKALGLDESIGSALNKLMVALPSAARPAAEETRRRILVDPTGWMRSAPEGLDLSDLHDAVFADRRIRIRYRHGGDVEERGYLLDPYGLVSKGGSWYLIADHRGKGRLFRADRIRSITVLEDPVQRRAKTSLKQLWEELRDRVENRDESVIIDLRVRRERIDMFARIIGKSVREIGDGAGEWVEAKMSVSEIRAVRQLLSFADTVEVVSPATARDELRRAAAEILELYGKQDQPR